MFRAEKMMIRPPGDDRPAARVLRIKRVCAIACWAGRKECKSEWDHGLIETKWLIVSSIGIYDRLGKVVQSVV